MAKETKQTKVVGVCEQYVVDKLKQTEKELEELKKEYELLKKGHDSLKELVIKGTGCVEITSVDGGPQLGMIKINGEYAKTIWLDSSKEDLPIQWFIALIKKGHNIVRREEK